jgi:hypothetical protein
MLDITVINNIQSHTHLDANELKRSFCCIQGMET